MNSLAVIHWNVSPELFKLGPIEPRWYGLLFALGFLIGYQVMLWIYSLEGKPARSVYRLFMTVFFGTIIGARLGHCLFYDPVFYLNNPLDIFKIWEGGLASHGATLGIMGAVYFYVRQSKSLDWLWVVDRMTIVVALASSLIRLGNLFNSEIIGKATTVPWAFIFERVDMIPRHPAQLYESLLYLGLFFFLLHAYKKSKSAIPEGRLTGIFLTFCFSGRFLIEFIKENQVAFEAGMPLNMGQLLSIPMVALGIWLWVRSVKR